LLLPVVLFAAAMNAGRRPSLFQFLLPIGVQIACVALIFIVLQAIG
jgi:hypothetical protein